eukprot:TRINITY_DN1765_c10_g1_i1.p1 TRINITY_DN1765_c10_g1~~TRINITY_DN1765_c10_g1_i1.p1  ORF type:complete len:902 (+),score=225.32 TRINITY_DN1765_c10_g1_i1:52-2757(+)
MHSILCCAGKRSPVAQPAQPAAAAAQQQQHTALCPEILVQVWTYLLHSPPDLEACELTCTSWRRCMQQYFWGVACRLVGLCSNASKWEFMSEVHHFHWRNAVWGDFPNSYVTRSDADDYLLYDTYPDVGFLYAHALLLFTVPKWQNRAFRREQWLRMYIPDDTLSSLLDPSGERPPQAEPFCMRRSRFRSSALTVKTDLCGSAAAMMTTEGVEIFTDSSEAVPVQDEQEAFPTEGPEAEFRPSSGKLDSEGMRSEDIAVLHISDGKVWALMKRPQGVQTWCAQTCKKLRFIPVPGVFEWPEDDPFYTWKSQEKFCFKDPSRFGVVIDDTNEVWALDTRSGCESPWWANVLCHSPSLACPFASHRAPVPTKPVATLNASPAVPRFSPCPAGGGVWSGKDSGQVDDPSLPPALDGGVSKPANVRVCGSCILLWGGRGVLDDTEDMVRSAQVPGRAFCQLWRPESAVNLSSTRNDLVCVLDVKYDHILMCHCDGRRVYVLFHPFHLEAGVPTHIQHVVVDVWDAWGGGFVCRRLGHDEDRASRPFFQPEDLTPAFIQILHADAEQLVYYCSQYKEESNYLSVRQLGTLASARERHRLLRTCGEGRVGAAGEASSHPWWQSSSVGGDGRKRFQVGLQLDDGDEPAASLHVFDGPPRKLGKLWESAPSDSPLTVGTLRRPSNRAVSTAGSAGWRAVAARLREAFRDSRRREEAELREELSLQLVGSLLGSVNSLRAPTLTWPPLRPDFAALRHLPPGPDRDRMLWPMETDRRQASADPVSHVLRRGSVGQRAPTAVSAPPSAYAAGAVVSTQLAQYSSECALELQQCSAAVWQHLSRLESGLDSDYAGGMFSRSSEATALSVRDALLGLYSGVLDQRLDDMFVHVPSVPGVRPVDTERPQQQQCKG